MGLFDKLFGTPKQNKAVAPLKHVLEEQQLYNLCIEKYKIMASEGKVIDWYCVEKTSNDIYPYPCATECEQRYFNDPTYQVLRGDAISIVCLIHNYVEGLYEENNNSDITVHKDYDKANYWKSVLVKGAEGGNRSFQAALITGGYLCDLWNPEKERMTFKDKYEKALFLDAQNGSTKAQYAVAQFELDGAIRGSQKKKEYLESAARDGYGDAYYWLAKDFKRTKEWDEKIPITYGDENSCYFYSLYLKGANTNNGAFVGHMQDWVADCYQNGECGFPEDLEKAKYYYSLAVKNGNSASKSSLNYILSRR